MHRIAGGRAILSRLQKLLPPVDYFSEARSSPELWPERILCFTRKNHREIEAEPLARHHHHRYVLIVPWKGQGEVDVDERRFLFSPGQALLIVPFQFHHFHGRLRGPIFWQFITFELRLPASLESMRPAPLRKIGARERDLLFAFTDAWLRRDQCDRELAPWLGLILARLQCAAPAGASHTAVSTGPETSLMARINRQCLPRLHEIFGLKDLATELGISESHLRARFRQETGISLGWHVRRLRLQKAMGLLAQSNLSVTQIADRCGFDTVFAFSRSFHRFAGVSAREYRQRHLR